MIGIISKDLFTSKNSEILRQNPPNKYSGDPYGQVPVSFWAMGRNRVSAQSKPGWELKSGICLSPFLNRHIFQMSLEELKGLTRKEPPLFQYSIGISQSSTIPCFFSLISFLVYSYSQYMFQYCLEYWVEFLHERDS